MVERNAEAMSSGPQSTRLERALFSTTRAASIEAKLRTALSDRSASPNFVLVGRETVVAAMALARDVDRLRIAREAQ